MDFSRASLEEAMGQCAWCGKVISEDTPVFGFGAKKRPQIDITEFKGLAIKMHLTKQNKDITAFVTTSDSQAKKDGYDFMFLVCSKECAREMKSVMDEEIALGEAIFKDIKEMG